MAVGSKLIFAEDSCVKHAVVAVFSLEVVVLLSSNGCSRVMCLPLHSSQEIELKLRHL